MQDYVEIAQKNGITLLDQGRCQFCGALTQLGVHECIELFHTGFEVIDFSDSSNHRFRFFIVDAHTLQHPEIHGRWNNHFHLTRLHLTLSHQVQWTYTLSPKLSDCLNRYKKEYPNEYLTPPKVLKRGKITTTDFREIANNETACKNLILNWAEDVYWAWRNHQNLVEEIAQRFLR